MAWRCATAGGCPRRWFDLSAATSANVRRDSRHGGRNRRLRRRGEVGGDGGRGDVAAGNADDAAARAADDVAAGNVDDATAGNADSRRRYRRWRTTSRPLAVSVDWTWGTTARGRGGAPPSPPRWRERQRRRRAARTRTNEAARFFLERGGGASSSARGGASSRTRRRRRVDLQRLDRKRRRVGVGGGAGRGGRAGRPRGARRPRSNAVGEAGLSALDALVAAGRVASNYMPPRWGPRERVADMEAEENIAGGGGGVVAATA